jgi:hypothetical protein
VLLETCAAVWIAENEKLTPQTVEVLRDVNQAGLPRPPLRFIYPRYLLIGQNRMPVSFAALHASFTL